MRTGKHPEEGTWARLWGTVSVDRKNEKERVFHTGIKWRVIEADMERG